MLADDKTFVLHSKTGWWITGLNTTKGLWSWLCRKSSFFPFFLKSLNRWGHPHRFLFHSFARVFSMKSSLHPSPTYFVLHHVGFSIAQRNQNTPSPQKEACNHEEDNRSDPQNGRPHDHYFEFIMPLSLACYALDVHQEQCCNSTSAIAP